MKQTKIIDSYWTLAIGLAVAGPFALPLLWRNPNFSKKTKIWATVIITFLTILLLYFSGSMVSQLNQKVEEFKALQESQ